MFPDSIRAYSSLAILYALSGRPAEVAPMLRALVEKNPPAVAYAEAVKTLRILNDPGSAARLLSYAQARLPGDAGLRTQGQGPLPPGPLLQALHPPIGGEEGES